MAALVLSLDMFHACLRVKPPGHVIKQTPSPIPTSLPNGTLDLTPENFRLKSNQNVMLQ